MDKNPWGGESLRRNNEIGYWEENTVPHRRRNLGHWEGDKMSHRRQNADSHREQHHKTDTDANGGVTRFCIRRYNTANTYPWEDPWESDSNSFNRKGHWKGNTVYFRRRNKKFQDEENKKF